MRRFFDWCFVALVISSAIPQADARPFRTRSKAVARTGEAKAKAVTRTGRVRRISTDEITTEQAINSAAPGDKRWGDWSRNSKRDTPGQGRQNDGLQ